jgi:cephalosporin-C deacetylase-like acetyl esterase
MDCIRAVDFLCSRPEVDIARIAVEGGSQGGALSFATAALDKRIMACAPDVPFLSDFPHYFEVASWPGNEFSEYMKQHPEIKRDEVFRVLSYIDIKNLAPRITCPVLMQVGLLDNVCPPHINFAAYNNLKSEKQYKVYPGAGHGLTSEAMDYKQQWLRKKLGLQ